jgi:hypothetical protein
VITDVLLDHAALVPLALLAVVVGCVLTGLLVLRLGHPAQRVLAALLVAALLPVVALTLVPAGRARGDATVCTVQFALPTPGSVELLANVALFVPPAFAAVLLTRRPMLALAGAALASALVETLQAVLPVLARACDTNDWAMNTAGAAAGVLLALGTLALSRHTGDRHVPRG